MLYPNKKSWGGGGVEVYWNHPVLPSICPSVREFRNLVRGITSKVLKLVTSNFIYKLHMRDTF